MIEAELTAARTADAVRGPASLAGEPVAPLPPQPKTVRETGLELSMLMELAAKAMYAGARTPLPVLAGKLRLSIGIMRDVLDAMVGEQMAEAGWGGDTDLDLQYHLTTVGKQRAAEYLARCRYAGPAPVTLQAYRDVCQRQSTRQSDARRIGAAEMAAAFADDHLDANVCEQLGAALQSSRSLLLYGPSGSGKSTLARKLGLLQQGLVAVPHAILVDQDIIQFYDPLVHLAPSLAARQGENQRSVDTRWSLCQRPVVQVGAELSQEMLDLRQLMYKQAAALRQHDFKADYALVQREVAPAIEKAVKASPRPDDGWATTEVRQLANGMFELHRIPADPVAGPVEAPEPLPVPRDQLAVLPAIVASEKALLEIRNGNGVTGMAKSLSHKIDSDTLQVVRLSNQRPFDVRQTGVEYEPAFRAAAERLAERFGNAVAVEVDGVKPANMRLVIGRDIANRNFALKPAASTAPDTFVQHQTPSEGARHNEEDPTLKPGA